jgi:hypothetical protein
MRPSHIAHIVTEANSGPDSRALWREIGVIWPHKSGKGFDLVIHPQLSVSGRIVCTERRDRAEERPEDAI